MADGREWCETFPVWLPVRIFVVCVSVQWNRVESRSHLRLDVIILCPNVQTFSRIFANKIHLLVTGGWWVASQSEPKNKVDSNVFSLLVAFFPGARRIRMQKNNFGVANDQRRRLTSMRTFGREPAPVKIYQWKLWWTRQRWENFSCRHVGASWLGVSCLNWIVHIFVGGSLCIEKCQCNSGAVAREISPPESKCVRQRNSFYYLVNASAYLVGSQNLIYEASRPASERC